MAAKLAIYKLTIPILFLTIIFPIFVLGLPASEERFSGITNQLDDEFQEINEKAASMITFEDSIHEEFLGFGVHETAEDQQLSTDICDTLDKLHDLIQRESLRHCPKSRNPQQGRAAGILAQSTCKPKLEDLLEEYPDCQCTSPALFTPKGRGNCNFGATSADPTVWCYISRQFGNPTNVCPDAKESKSRSGWHWSKFACIT